MTEICVGIDIGGTNSVFGLVDKHGKIHAKGTLPTANYEVAEEFVKAISIEIKKALSPDMKLLAVGVGVPNGNFFKGTIEFAPNLKWKGVIPLAKYFEENLKVKALLTNDANAATIGEMIFGNAIGLNDFLFITLGTGLGSGIVANGELIYGHDSFAGEVGHVIVKENGRLCGCGRRGCLETYCSAPGIVKTYRELINNENLEISAKDIFDLAKSGNEKAIEAFKITGEILGLALANSVVYTAPEKIFLFGGLAQSGELLFKPTRESFEANVLKIWQNKIQIVPSGLDESDAAILGSASLVWKINQKYRSQI